MTCPNCKRQLPTVLATCQHCGWNRACPICKDLMDYFRGFLTCRKCGHEEEVL